MIITKETAIDLGGTEIILNLVANNEEILMANLEAEETPLWVELWPAALGLARYLWQNPPAPGAQVLELGAGLGLPGVVAALRQALVLQTDYVQAAVDVAKQTALINAATGMQHAVADWRNWTITQQFDLIIGSDITYHPDLNPYLEKIFLSNLKPGGSLLIADSGRIESEKFLSGLMHKEWTGNIDSLPVHLDKFDYQIKIYRLQRVK